MAGAVGVRIRKHHQDEVRARIQVSQIVNVLENQALGKGDDLSPARLKAIEILLRKSLPDLSAIELTGADGGAIRIVASAPDEAI